MAHAERAIVTPGGKPLNVARFLGAMGIECSLILVADESIARAAAASLPSRVRVATVVSTAESRTDVAIVGEDATLTVVNGPAPALSPDELERALEETSRALSPGDVLVIAGSQPDGAFARLLGIAERASAGVVVDVSGADLRASMAVVATLVKVNASELAEAAGVDEERAWSHAPELLPRAENVVVTRGAQGLRGWLSDGRMVRVPAVETKVVNPYGAGDAVTAALAAALDPRGLDPEALIDAGAWAAAVAADAGLDLDPEVARPLRERARAIDEGRWERAAGS